jgi:hypothetical protein
MIHRAQHHLSPNVEGGDCVVTGCVQQIQPVSFREMFFQYCARIMVRSRRNKISFKRCTAGWV